MFSRKVCRQVDKQLPQWVVTTPRGQAWAVCFCLCHQDKIPWWGVCSQPANTMQVTPFVPFSSSSLYFENVQNYKFLFQLIFLKVFVYVSPCVCACVACTCVPLCVCEAQRIAWRSHLSHSTWRAQEIESRRPCLVVSAITSSVILLTPEILILEKCNNIHLYTLYI